MPDYTWISHPIRSKQWLPSCCICNTAVSLETSKTDEHGQAVHEECYVLKVGSTAEFAGDARYTRSPANRAALYEVCNAATAEPLKAPISRLSVVFTTLPTQPAKRLDRLKRAANVDRIAVAAILVLTCWIAYSNRLPASLLKFSQPQKAIALEQQASLLHAKAVSARRTPRLRTRSLSLQDARTRTSFRRPGENEIDYVKDDVTVRYFTHTSPQPVVKSEIAYIGKDVTVRYFTPKPTEVSPARLVESAAQPAESSSSVPENSPSSKPTQ
jgi:hypothetical protein